MLTKKDIQQLRNDGLENIALEIELLQAALILFIGGLNECPPHVLGAFKSEIEVAKELLGQNVKVRG